MCHIGKFYSLRDYRIDYREPYNIIHYEGDRGTEKAANEVQQEIQKAEMVAGLMESYTFLEYAKCKGNHKGYAESIPRGWKVYERCCNAYNSGNYKLCKEVANLIAPALMFEIICHNSVFKGYSITSLYSSRSPSATIACHSSSLHSLR